MRIRQLIDLVSFFLVVGGLGWFIQNFFDPYPQTIIALCGINVILATSLNLVNGFTGQFSMGHAGFMAIGAYVGAALTTIVFPHLGLGPGPLQPVYFFVATVAAGVAASLVGLVVGIPSLRLKGDYLAIVTLGFGEIIRIFILNVNAVGGARGLGGIPLMSNMYWIVGWVVFTCIFLARLIRSVSGKQFMAVRDDETATMSMGLSTTQIKVRAFIFASFFAGIAGSLFAHYYTYLNPSTFTFNYSFQIIAMVVLGGMGSLTGSIVSAILLTELLEQLRKLQDITGVDLRMVIYALVLIGLMLTRPQGMFGQRELLDFIPFWRNKKKAGALIS